MTPFCTYELCENYTEGSTQFCATHNAELRKAERMAKKVKIVKPIRKVSAQRSSQMFSYSANKAAFLKGKKCPIYPMEPCTSLHHMAGRTGYIDEWATEKGITATMDERYWLACSVRGHERIELNPQWAKEKGYSVSRLTKK